MVLTEAFASIDARRGLRHRRLPRRGARRRSTACWCPPADPAALGEALRDLALDPAPARGDGRGRARARRALLLAARDRRGHRGLRATRSRCPAPERRGERARSRLGLAAADRAPLAAPPAAVDRARGARRTARATAVRVARRAAVIGAGAGGVGLTALALDHIGIESIGRAVVAATPVWVLVAFALMCASMLIRAEAWHAILRAALPGTRVRRRDTARATMIGVLMSATLPARLGEPSRALILARRVGRVRDRLPVVLGTLVSQTLLNILALADPRRRDVRHRGHLPRRRGRAGVRHDRSGRGARRCCSPSRRCCAAASRRASRGCSRRWPRRARRWCRCARGLAVFRQPRLGRAGRPLTQLPAWAVQWLACYVLLVALGLDDRAGIGAAAAVLFAVNVTAALPATPSNLGVFQAACVAVLSAYGVGQDRRAGLRDHPAGGGDRDRAGAWACPRWCARA